MQPCHRNPNLFTSRAHRSGNKYPPVSKPVTQASRRLHATAAPADFDEGIVTTPPESCMATNIGSGLARQAEIDIGYDYEFEHKWAASNAACGWPSVC